MVKIIFSRSVMISVSFILLCCASGYAENNKVDFDRGIFQTAVVMQQDTSDPLRQESLKRQCLAATITAINMEIDRYNEWIELRKTQGETEDLAALQGKLAALKEDLAKYSSMDSENYVLPDKVMASAWVAGQADDGSILYVDNMSRSGPWYHLAGIAGGDYAVLQSNTKRNLSFYPVYRRDYGGMYSAYVYVADGFSGNHQDIDGQPGRRFTGEVFTIKSPVHVAEKVRCEKYQIYLLKDNLPAAEGKLVFDSTTSEFDFTLPKELLEQYSYLEFVSTNRSQTVKLSEITDAPLEIVLQLLVVVKKPAIYLYPVKQSQIVVTHTFKGKIMNTYPAYEGNWTVIADPSGNLFNTRDQRFYKYLFWDGAYVFPDEHYHFNDGYYVKSQDYVSFLQNKLATIGLNENEINDFIVYWLPAMSKYQYCFIHFRINDNIDGSSVLVTNPASDTMIRVFMEFSGVNESSIFSRLPEQKLPSFVRSGFTLVEWGGAEIGTNKLE